MRKTAGLWDQTVRGLPPPNPHKVKGKFIFYPTLVIIVVMFIICFVSFGFFGSAFH